MGARPDRLRETRGYTSRDLERELPGCGALASMGGVAVCYDIAMPESFFASALAWGLTLLP
jgi:hypothetical protein